MCDDVVTSGRNLTLCLVLSYILSVDDDKIAISYKENFIPPSCKVPDNRKHKDKRKSEGLKEITLK